MLENKDIFFAALDWGLGHSTRSIPLLRQLARSNRVTIGVSESQREFYRSNFKDLEQLALPSYGIRYSRLFPAWLVILLRSPKLLFIIRKEQKLLQGLLKTKSFDVIISDNRYGLYDNSGKIQTVFITHQLHLQAPFWPALANFLHGRLLKRFSEIWVPDFAEEERSLGGRLSHPASGSLKIKYIGPQSQLQAANRTGPAIAVLVLLSGPEPQREHLEKIMVSHFFQYPEKVVLIRGTSAARGSNYGTIEVLDLVPGEILAFLIARSELIICRSGYSTLMDVYTCNKTRLILIPTPGQTEQEYLADYWQKKYRARSVTQKKIPRFLKENF